MNDDDLTRAVAVRVGVLFARTPVGGPASVADPVGAVEWLETDRFFQIAQLAFGAANLQPFPVAGHSDPGRIISAIFQATQTIDDDRHHALFPDVSNDPAHETKLLL